MARQTGAAAEGRSEEDPGATPDRAASGACWVRWTLPLLLLGVVLKGHDVRFWPLIGWPMYARFQTHFPLTQPIAAEVRVHDADGHVQRFRPPDLLPLEWNNAAEGLIRRAFAEPGHPAAQQALTSLLRRRRPPGSSAITRVEAWRLEWDVPAFRLPLLDPDRPHRESRVGGFAVPPCGAAEACPR